MAINPIELLLTMKNLIGPPVAEAEVQLAGLKSSVTGASAAMEANTVAAAGMSTAMTAGLAVSIGGAVVAVAGLALALKSSADRMMELGESANQADLLGQHLSDTDKMTQRFYVNVTEAHERIVGWGNNLKSVFFPILDTMAEKFNRITEGLEKFRMPAWFEKYQAIQHAIGNVIDHPNGYVGPTSTLDNSRSGYIFGTGITDYQNLHANDPVSGGRKRSGSDRMPQPDVWDYISAAGSYQSPALDRMQSDAGDPLLKLEKTLRTVKVPADAFSDSVGRIQQMAQRASWEMVSLGRDVITGTTTIGEAFKSLIADILMSIAQKKAADFLTNLALGAATGGVGGVAVGAAAGSAGPVTVNISALSSKDVLRSLTSSSGEMNQSYRQLGIAARLP